MPRVHIIHTENGTVAHGYIVHAGEARPMNYTIDGRRLSLKSAESRVRRIHDPTFSIESVTHYRKVYRMRVDEFVERAELIDISEEGE